MRFPACVQLLLFLLGIVKATRVTQSVYFKMLDDDRFIGHDTSSKELKLVEANRAIKFQVEDTENVAEKKLITVDKKEAFTEEGYWGFRKWYEMDSPDRGDRQGINIVYNAPGVYVLMRDGSCLSEVYGLFRKVDCTQPDINKFKMCKNLNCSTRKGHHRMHRDVQVIKSLLMNSGMIERRPQTRPRSVRRKRASPVSQFIDTDNSDSDDYPGIDPVWIKAPKRPTTMYGIPPDRPRKRYKVRKLEPMEDFCEIRCSDDIESYMDDNDGSSSDYSSDSLDDYSD